MPDVSLWERSPFEQLPGEFWDPQFPEARYSGTYFTHMDLPFVEIPRANRPDRMWGLRYLAGVLVDGREVLLLGHLDATHSIQVMRDDEGSHHRYRGIGALVGAGAASISEGTRLRSVTLHVQNLGRWMGEREPATALIGSGFMDNRYAEGITATVDQSSRKLTVDLGTDLPLRQSLTLLDEAEYLVRKAIGCLAGMQAIAREQTVYTETGEAFTWIYARWEPPLREPISTNTSVPLGRAGTAATLMSRFQLARKALWPATDVLHVNLSSPDLYTEHRFVGLISGVEGVHSKLGESVEKEKQWTGELEGEFTEARNVLKAHLKNHSSEELKSALLLSLKNQRTFAQKLGDIFDHVGVAAEGYLGIDRAKWIKQAIYHRNRTAHAATTSTEQSDTADDSAKYRALSIVAEEMLRQVLLIKMGIDSDTRESSAMRAGSNLRQSGYEGFLRE